MTRKVIRDDSDEKMGQDVLVRDGFGATSPRTRMVPCLLVWRLYKPKSETTDPIYVASKTITIPLSVLIIMEIKIKNEFR